MQPGSSRPCAGMHACTHPPPRPPTPGWTPRAPTVINIKQLEKDTQLVAAPGPSVICRPPGRFISIAPENLLMRISPGQASSSSDRRWLLALQLIRWREDGEVSGRQGGLWPIPLASFFPQQIPSQRCLYSREDFCGQRRRRWGELWLPLSSSPSGSHRYFQGTLSAPAFCPN